MILRLLLSFLSGVVMHTGLYKPTGKFGPRWGLMMRYAIGSLIMIPLRLLVESVLPEQMKKHEKHVIADLLTLGSFGGGVLTGHMVETLFEKRTNQEN